MKSLNRTIYTLLLCLVMTGVGGCFGDSILTATSKVLGGQISQLSANEIIILNQTVSDLVSSQNPGTSVPTLTQTQAAAVSDFLVANQINTIDDIQALSTTAQTDPTQLQGLDALAAAFAGSNVNIDPNNLDPNTIDNVFGALFGGGNTGVNLGG